MNRDSVLESVKQKIIYEGLELEDVGIELEEIEDDTALFTADGLDLDSVDALEVMAAVQREYSIRFGDVDGSFIEEHCGTPAKIADTILKFMAEAA